MRTIAGNIYELETRLEVGLAKAPFLADHGFHGLAVLPGAYYIAAALTFHRENELQRPAILRNIRFHRPAILSQAKTTLQLCVRELTPGSGKYLYCFFEEPALGPSQDLDGMPIAQLEIEIQPASLLKNEKVPSPLAAFQNQAECIPGAELYRAFRKSGNEYGMHFQKITTAWREGGKVMARVEDQEQLAHRVPLGMHPILLDAMTQALGATQVHHGRTFVLESIESIRFVADQLPSDLWVQACQTAVSPSEQRFSGEVHVLDPDGRSLLQLSGVTCRLLEMPQGSEADATPAFNVCIAGTTTTEPLEESLQFWARQFKFPLAVKFAPHNQVMQQLLDSTSEFTQNPRETNIILLDLEEWLSADEKQSLSERFSQAQAVAQGVHGRVLPNGLRIRELNGHETDYLFKEIFEDNVYLRHGIALNDGATVLDIGANIGVFSLFVLSQCRNPRIYAFEPAPATYACLEANLKIHAPPGSARTFQCGVSDQAKQAPLTFYEHASVFSSFHADAEEDQVALEQVVRNILEKDSAPLESDVEQLMQGRLEPRTFLCDLVSVSQIIRQHGIERIDLLKIDAERSELEILQGIDDEHWPLIGQMVIEVHDRSKAALTQVEALLNARGFVCAITEETLLANSGLINLYAKREQSHRSPTALRMDTLQSQIDTFGSALNRFVQQSNAPVLLALLPRTPRAGAYAPLHARLNEAERQVVSWADATPRVTCLRSDLLFSPVTAAQYFDEHSQELAHMPYTPEGYAAAGTALFRALVRPLMPPFKVLVLDCDDTLWQGVCAEDGPGGVKLGHGHYFLQQWAVEQMRRGLLVCLCSKNEEEDVWAVFDRRTEMTLRREHLAAWRINWDRKSDNLRALAEQLHLGLDSFIFLDDNPLECAEVRASCPEVLVLALPKNPEARPGFLERIWAWNATPTTEIDGQRTLWYQTNREREALQRSSASFKQFLESLDVQIQVCEPTTDQLGRVAQLTRRTNQFNFTQIRRSDQDILDFLVSGKGCLVAHVRDRLGDYGLVGAVLYCQHPDHYEIDSFLLSCRALGKGVEHQMLATLSRHAIDAGKSFIRAPFTPTARNRPAQQFLQSVADECIATPAGGFVFRLSAPKCASLSFNPIEPTEPSIRDRVPQEQVQRSHHLQISGVMQGIGEDLYAPGRILQASRSVAKPTVARAVEGGANTASGITGQIARIFSAILSREDIGWEDNFFDLGGTSLKAVLVTAAIRREIGQQITLVTLFECPTIKSLAARLDTKDNHPEEMRRTAVAQERGRQRRYAHGRRKEILL